MSKVEFKNVTFTAPDNISAFNYLNSITDKLFIVPMGTYWDEDEEKRLENEYDPLYAELKDIIHMSRSSFYEKWVLNSIDISHIEIDESIKEDLDFHNKNSRYKYTLNEWYLMFNVFLTEDDCSLLYNGLIKETEIETAMKNVGMTRGGADILNYPLRHALNADVSYPPFILGNNQLFHPLDIHTTLTSLSLTMTEWGKLPKDEKISTIALDRIDSIRKNHIEDIAAIQQESKSRSK